MRSPLPVPDPLLEKQFDVLADKVEGLEGELKYAWRALDVLSQEYVKMWQRLEKMEGLLGEQQAVISQLIDLYSAGDSSDNNGGKSLNSPMSGAVVPIGGAVPDESFYKSLNMAHGSQVMLSRDHSLEDFISPDQRDDDDDPVQPRQRRDSASSSKHKQGTFSDFVNQYDAPKKGHRKSKAPKHHQLPLPPGPSKRARGGGQGFLETEEGESTEDIDAKSTTSVRTSQSEEISEASRKRQISPNGYDNITPPFPTGSLDEAASNTVIRRKKKDKKKAVEEAAAMRRASRERQGPIGGEEVTSTQPQKQQGPLTVIGGKYSFSLGDKSDKGGKAAAAALDTAQGATTGVTNGKPLFQTVQTAMVAAAPTAAASQQPQQVIGKLKTPPPKTPVAAEKSRKMSLKEKRKLRAERDQRELDQAHQEQQLLQQQQQQQQQQLQLNQPEPLPAKKLDSSESDQSMRSDKTLSPKMELVGAAANNKSSSSSREFAVSRALGKYRQQKQLTKSDTATTATTSNSESPPEETAIMTPARSSKDGAATTTTATGDSDADIEAELKNLDARLAEIDGSTNKKMAALHQGPETAIGTPPLPDTPPRTRAIKTKAKVLKPTKAVDIPPKQQHVGMRQSTEDDPVDPNDEWYRHEMRELERMEHEHAAAKITPSPSVELKMGQVLGELGDTVNVVTQEECESAEEERRKREEEEREDKKRRRRGQQRRAAGEEGEERAGAMTESSGEEKALLAREPPAGARPPADQLQQEREGETTAATSTATGKAPKSLLRLYTTVSCSDAEDDGRLAEEAHFELREKEEEEEGVEDALRPKRAPAQDSESSSAHKAVRNKRQRGLRQRRSSSEEDETEGEDATQSGPDSLAEDSVDDVEDIAEENGEAQEELEAVEKGSFEDEGEDTLKAEEEELEEGWAEEEAEKARVKSESESAEEHSPPQQQPQRPSHVDLKPQASPTPVASKQQLAAPPQPKAPASPSFSFAKNLTQLGKKAPAPAGAAAFGFAAFTSAAQKLQSAAEKAEKEITSATEALELKVTAAETAESRQAPKEKEEEAEEGEEEEQRPPLPAVGDSTTTLASTTSTSTIVSEKPSPASSNRSTASRPLSLASKASSAAAARFTASSSSTPTSLADSKASSVRGEEEEEELQEEEEEQIPTPVIPDSADEMAVDAVVPLAEPAGMSAEDGEYPQETGFPDASTYDAENYGNEEEYADAGGYYDENGEWVDTSGGYYDENGEWVDTSGGYYDENGEWVEGTGATAEADAAAAGGGGYYDENGDWVEKGGYYDESGTYVEYCGYYDENGDWIDVEPPPEQPQEQDQEQQQEPMGEDAIAAGDEDRPPDPGGGEGEEGNAEDDGGKETTHSADHFLAVTGVAAPTTAAQVFPQQASGQTTPGKNNYYHEENYYAEGVEKGSYYDESGVLVEYCGYYDENGEWIDVEEDEIIAEDGSYLIGEDEDHHVDGGGRGLVARMSSDDVVDETTTEDAVGKAAETSTTLHSEEEEDEDDLSGAFLTNGLGRKESSTLGQEEEDDLKSVKSDGSDVGRSRSGDASVVKGGSLDNEETPILSESGDDNADKDNNALISIQGKTGVVGDDRMSADEEEEEHSEKASKADASDHEEGEEEDGAKEANDDANNNMEDPEVQERMATALAKKALNRQTTAAGARWQSLGVALKNRKAEILEEVRATRDPLGY